MSAAVQPLLSYGGVVSPPVLAFLSQFTFNSSYKYVAGGISDTGGVDKAVIRHATTANGLATAPNIPIGLSAPILSLYQGGGMQVASGGLDIATSIDGDNWSIGINSSGFQIVGGIGGVYDDVNDKVIIAVQTGGNGGVITATPGAGIITFATQTLGAGSQEFIALAARPGSGVVLGITNQGLHPQDIWRSTDGGSTWTKTATDIFGSGNAFGIYWLDTQWIALGGDPSSLMSFSTDDGDTWSAPVATPWAGGFVQISSDGSGNLVLLLNDIPPDNYWISSNSGATWTSPNLFSAQGGPGANGIFWTGTQWVTSFSSADGTSAFFAVSIDGGQNWTPGSNVVD